MLNNWQQVQIIDLSTYVTGQLLITPAFDKEKISFLFKPSFYALNSYNQVSPILLPT
jgi:hypothetical protein